MKLRQDQIGAINPIIIVVAVAVIGVLGFAGWKVYDNNKSKDQTSGTSAVSKEVSAEVNAECEKEYNDKDFCKFASNWELAKIYKVSYSTKSADGTTSNFTSEVNGDNSSLTSSENGTENYAVITVDKVVYTKDYDKNVWYKLPETTSTDTTETSSTPDEDLDFIKEEPEQQNTVTIKALGKEACGDNTCFKYQIIDSSDTETTENLIWFDDKDYRLARMMITTKDGTVTDGTYTYPDSITIAVPSPVEDYPSFDPNSIDPSLLGQ